MSFTKLTRRGLIQTGAVAGAGLALPTYLRAEAHAGFTNAPTGSTVTLGFNVPQTGPYAEEGLDELRAQELTSIIGSRNTRPAMRPRPDILSTGLRS